MSEPSSWLDPPAGRKGGAQGVRSVVPGGSSPGPLVAVLVVLAVASAAAVVLLRPVKPPSDWPERKPTRHSF